MLDTNPDAEICQLGSEICNEKTGGCQEVIWYCDRLESLFIELQILLEFREWMKLQPLGLEYEILLIKMWLSF
mgnify:CR=1 FL=1